MNKFKGLTDREKIDLLKKAVSTLSKDYNAKLRTQEVEFNTDIHASRARQTTVYANSYKANKSYHDGLNWTKEILKNII
jgi:hypothetical protein